MLIAHANACFLFTVARDNCIITITQLIIILRKWLQSTACTLHTAQAIGML